MNPRKALIGAALHDGFEFFAAVDSIPQQKRRSSNELRRFCRIGLRLRLG